MWHYIIPAALATLAIGIAGHWWYEYVVGTGEPDPYEDWWYDEQADEPVPPDYGSFQEWFDWVARDEDWPPTHCHACGGQYVGYHDPHRTNSSYCLPEPTQEDIDQHWREMWQQWND